MMNFAWLICKEKTKIIPCILSQAPIASSKNHLLSTHLWRQHKKCQSRKFFGLY